MNAAKLLKQAPTILLTGFLGYSLYAMQSGIPGEFDASTELKKDLDRLVDEVFAEGSTAAARLEGKLRDPFWGAAAPAAAPEPTARDTPAAPEVDPVADYVRGMSLEATFIQGRDQLAIIDGRIYSKGARIPVPGDDGPAGRALQLVGVTRTAVLFQSGSRNYALLYPDNLARKKPEEAAASAPERATSEIDPGGQMEMFQKLLNSPLGAMGRSLIGDAAGLRNARGRQATPARPRGAGAG